MASTPIATASTLVAMASNLVAMASCGPESHDMVFVKDGIPKGPVLFIGLDGLDPRCLHVSPDSYPSRYQVCRYTTASARGVCW